MDGTRYKHRYDDFDAQKAYFTTFVETLIENSEAQPEYSGMEIIIFNQEVSRLKFQEISNGDFIYAVFSIAFVFIYITFHLKSLFMSSFAVVNILLSFPLSLALYKFIF